MHSDSRAAYLVGIDLGTTHTVVSYLAISSEMQPQQRRIFEIEQLVAPGEVAALPLLPSFRYHPLDGEIASSDCQLPWGDGLSALIDGVPAGIIGHWARDLGARVDGRQVVSAKSWLSHPQVDRREAILPWGGCDDVVKISPLHASASYLAYVRAAWNHRCPDAPLEQQDVVITVPASFDEMARALTLEAATLAGLQGIHLLEEPQAVCYDWMSRQSDAAETMGDARHLLVCDVGGGTTDLSLIKMQRQPSGEVEWARVAVGDHLMLGGDNIDLALAHVCEQRLQLGKALSAAQLSQLIQQTRVAKERLLSSDAPEQVTVTLLGSGARLIGGAKRCELRQSDIQQIALDGFLPLSAVDELPAKRRSAVVEFGLPYASDPAISRHLAAFLAQQQSQLQSQPQSQLQSQRQGDDSERVWPDALLLNGGVFNSPRLVARLQQLLGSWRGDEALLTLDNSHPDLAVAQGAVAYAMARRGSQQRIRSGAARAYFLAVERSGEDEDNTLICLLPRGTDEEQEIKLDGRRFLLTLDRPVRFDVYYSNVSEAKEIGSLSPLSDEYSPLPPLVAALSADDDKAQEPQVAVELVCKLTEVGTLQLVCQHCDSDRRWNVEFQVRDSEAAVSHLSAEKLPDGWDAARERLLLIFGKSKQKVDPKAVKNLRHELEKLLGKRDQWSLPLLRAIFDQLLEGMEQRKRSQAHERVWLNLVGYCLRPGFGDPADDWRIAKLIALWDEGLHYDRETQSWIDWWTLWRRVAGGLASAQQVAVYDTIKPFLDPAALQSRKRQAEAKLKSYEDMVKLAGSLEHLPQPTKIELGGWLLKRLKKPSETQTSWWALGRLGSREPFHGGIHEVVSADDVRPWLQAVLAENWKKNTQAAFAGVMMARQSGDRSRDLDPSERQTVVSRLQQDKCPDSWVALVESGEAVDEQESRRIFGEALPAGLQLISAG